MTPGTEEKTRRMDPIVQKLIFALLGAVFVVMTGIGGATASHMVAQNDEIITRLSKIEATIAVEDVYNKDLERRIDSIEHQIDRTRPR